MKKVIILSALILIVLSCSNYRSENFNKQKYTIFTKRFVTTDQVKNTDNPIQKELTKKIALQKVKKIEQHAFVEDIVINKIDTKTNSKYKFTTKKEATVKLSKRKKHFRKTHKKSNKRVETESTTDENKINGLFFFLMLLGFPLMFIKKSGYKIALWGKHNVKKAQVLIGVFTVSGLFSSYLLGNILDFNISAPMFILPVSLGLGSLVVNKVKSKRHFFKNKMAMSMLSTSSLFLSFSAGNSASYKVMDLSKEMSLHPILAVIITIIIIALLALSIYGLAALACLLACGGAELLAAIVFITGTLGLSFLATLAIVKLFRKMEKPKTKKDKETLLWANVLVLIVTGLVIYFTAKF